MSGKCLRVTSGYIALVAVYFGNAVLGDGDLTLFDEMVKTAPLLFLGAIVAMEQYRGARLLAAALLLSAVGDWAGERGLFLSQVGSFMAAHVAFALYFLRRTKADAAGILLSVALVATGIAAGAFLLPHIGSLTERVMCGGYIAAILTMAVSAILRQGVWRWAGAGAALLFIFSDGCIAWNRFVEPLPYAGLWIMSAYFAAQYIFAIIGLKEGEGK
ncbi:MAG: lysoplasmalogenase [Alistipes sp.]